MKPIRLRCSSSSSTSSVESSRISARSGAVVSILCASSSVPDFILQLPWPCYLAHASAIQRSLRASSSLAPPLTFGRPLTLHPHRRDPQLGFDTVQKLVKGTFILRRPRANADA